MLYELLVVLAGYPSRIEDIAFSHSSERDIFIKATLFGEKHALLRRILDASEGSLSVLAGPLTELVSTPLLEAIVNVENAILKGDPRYGPRNGVSLAAVMSDTVETWQRRLDYATSLIQSNSEIVELTEQLRLDSRSGFEDVAHIATECLKAADRAWLKEVSPWILYGSDPPKSEGYHTALESITVQKLWDLGSILNRSNVLDSFSTEEAIQTSILENERLLETVPIPIEDSSFGSILNQVQKRAHSSILANKTMSNQMSDLLSILRNVVFLGSSSFTDAFFNETRLVKHTHVDSSLFRRALASYYEDSPELSATALKLAEQILHFKELDSSEQIPSPYGFDDLLFGVRTGLQLNVEWPLSLYFNTQHLRLYGDLFNYLLVLRMANDSLQIANPKMQYAKLFYNVLWQWIQTCLDEAMDKLNQLTQDVPGNDHGHTMILQEVGKKLLLDSRPLREILRTIILSTLVLAQEQEASPEDSIRHFVRKLSARSDMAHLLLQLEPFA